MIKIISLNYPCLEHIFMVPKVFEPLKFYCICGNHVIYHPGLVVLAEAVIRTQVSAEKGETVLLTCTVAETVDRVTCCLTFLSLSLM